MREGISFSLHLPGAAMAGGELFLEKRKGNILLLENNINHILTSHLTI
jgi:hypothetical protein